MRQLQKKIKTGTLNLNQDDPFELFVAATSIRYCYYNETHKILGNTFGMCVLQVSSSSSAEHQWFQLWLVYLLYDNSSLFCLHKCHVTCIFDSDLLSITQDFEALTPNLLARTIETVEGGGIVVLLLRTMNSLKQLYTMTMVSVHY